MAQLEKLEGNKAKLTITVDAETFRKAGGPARAADVIEQRIREGI